jgi:small RNA 2'-O-methyltransferase
VKAGSSLPRPDRRAARFDLAGSRAVPGWEETSTALHQQRLDAVMAQLLGHGVESVIDLGCGAGALLERLVAAAAVRRIVGVDASARALAVAEQRLAAGAGSPDGRLALRHASLTDVAPEFEGFDAVVMVETIEHIEPEHLGRVERTVFTRLRPRLAIITTPNREYNPLLGVADGRLRHPDHRFEWDRPRFEQWAAGIGNRNDYGVEFEGIGPGNAWFGSATQMAIFQRRTPTRHAVD